MKQKNKPRPKAPDPSDQHLAVISVILGAASFMTTVFTGIPAIIIGIMALRRKAPNLNQAKLGILFGVLGSLLIIPIIWLAVYFLSKPINQQLSVPVQDSRQIKAIATALGQYKRKTGAFPTCSPTDTPASCADWQQFTADHPDLVNYPLEFETMASAIKDRPAGSLVYALRTTCFLSVPVEPSSVDKYAQYHTDEYSALIYFHDQGRACFAVD